MRRGTIFVAVAALLAAHTRCGSNDNGGDWEEVTTYEVTKGVVTTLEEVETDKYEIVDEQIVEGKDASRVIIKRLNGTVDSLTLAQARGLVGAQDTVYREVQSHQGYHGHGMGSVLWWGAMGYMMGRSFNTPTQPGFYRQQSGSPAGYAYNRTSEQLKSTAIPRTEMRPVSGKSGYFRNSGRGSSTGS
ncbi:MAG: hypothetical protein SFV52_15595 [Saprospiraceae bacterium]|nr:hypothetical protein [Saprospiraceae bacterium]